MLFNLYKKTNLKCLDTIDDSYWLIDPLASRLSRIYRGFLNIEAISSIFYLAVRQSYPPFVQCTMVVLAKTPFLSSLFFLLSSLASSSYLGHCWIAGSLVAESIEVDPNCEIEWTKSRDWKSIFDVAMENGRTAIATLIRLTEELNKSCQRALRGRANKETADKRIVHDFIGKACETRSSM